MAYCNAVVWTCVRTHSPLRTGILVICYGKGPGDWARIYYEGFHHSVNDNEAIGSSGPVSRWKFGRSSKSWTSLIGEFFAIATTTMTAYEACTPTPDHVWWRLQQNDPRRISQSTWTVPQLPTTVVGLFFFTMELFFGRGRRRWRGKASCFCIRWLGALGRA